MFYANIQINLETYIVWVWVSVTLKTLYLTSRITYLVSDSLVQTTKYNLKS